MTSGAKLRMSIALTAIAVLVSAVAAGMTATEAIEERHEAMERIGESIGALAAIAKKKAPFDAEVVRTNAERIEAELKKSTEFFPEGSESGDHETWARPEIWSDREKFDEIFQSCIEAAVALQAVEEERAFLPALGALGNHCKSCHNEFRRPKD
jgi:cytochrome c556